MNKNGKQNGNPINIEKLFQAKENNSSLRN